MLNERIEKYIEIADSKGLFFVWQSIVHGVASINSLIYLRSHHTGKLCLNIIPTLLLLEEMGYITVDGDNIQIVSISNNYETEEEFTTYFSGALVDYLLEEEVISLESLKYNCYEDCFILARNGIKYKHASYRNLLLSLGVLRKREDGAFIFEKKIDTIIEIAPAKNKKKSEQSLLEELEQQRLEGFAGEQFVIRFEQNRLVGHPLIRKIKQISVVDVAAGFDIMSFNDISSSKLDRFIEVKTFKGNPHFHLSANEIRISNLRADHYYLYLVDYNKISEQDYEPIIIQNPSEYFDGNDDWIITPDSFLYEKRITGQFSYSLGASSISYPNRDEEDNGLLMAAEAEESYNKK
jgi:hypothetical protein